MDSEDLVEEAKNLHDQIVSQELTAFAPELILVEVANVMFWKKRFKKEKIIDFLNFLNDGRINMVSYYNFELSELLEVMDEYKLSVYDAYYVCLAKRNDCKVVTLDEKMSKVRGLVVKLGDLVH